MKKTFYGLGSIAIIASPIAMVVSCSVQYKGGVIYKRSDKELLINLSKYTTEHGIYKIAKDFESVLVKNNVLKTKVGTKLSINISWKYKSNKTDKFGNPSIKNAIYKFNYTLASISKDDPKISRWGVKYDFAKKIFKYLTGKGFVGGDINSQKGWKPGISKPGKDK